MIRIAISVEAVAAIARTLPPGSAGYDRRRARSILLTRPDMSSQTQRISAYHR
jgi:hypothetical protein